MTFSGKTIKAVLSAVTLAAALSFTSVMSASANSVQGGPGGGGGGTGGHESGVSVTANAQSLVEGESRPLQIGTFIDPDGTATANQYAASVEWGDGASGLATIVRTDSGSSPAHFAMTAAHAYHYNGTFMFCITVSDVDNQNRAEGCAMATAAEAPVTVRGITDALTNPYCDATATISDGNPFGWAGDFSATIDWGDGTISSGNVVWMSAGHFAVQACHTYANLGPHTLTTTVSDESSFVAAVTSTAWVYAMTDGGSFVIGDGSAALENPVKFWGGGWASANTLSGGDAPDSFKGFASGRSPICNGTWTAGPGGSSTPPSTVPTYTAMLVSSSITKDESKINGNSIHVALVRTDPGYGPTPEQAATGTVVYMIC